VIDRNQIHEGMVVRGSQGKKLGRVVSCTEGSFVVEKGFFLVTDHAAGYGDVAEISGDTIQLSRPWEEFAHSERTPSIGHERGVVWPSYGDEGGGGVL
jgi:hypothetical protein